MCGISGFVNADGLPASEGILAVMLRALVHRGPDDEGRYLEGPVALGHRRLSIIDLATGRQPLSNESGSLRLVTNGEIYNYRALRSETEARGHRYRTASDAEVILHLYEDEGVACLRRLNGMFAFALWDGPRERLWLVRDRAGKKPLYYTQTSQGVVFASELKALLAHPEVSQALNPQGVGWYLTHGFVPTPHTVLDRVMAVPPGCHVVMEHGTARVESYWQLPESGEASCDPTGVVDEFRRRFTQATTRRLVADVPVGVWLSGGWDSSSIVAALAQANVQPIRTFSLGVDEPSYDERPFARAVARHFHTSHQDWRITHKDLLDVIPRLGSLVDEPMADASIVPTYLLARLTRSHVKVVLGGDGSDELLGGYPTYQAHELAGRYRSVPGWFRRGVINPVIQRLPVSFRYLSAEFLLKKFVAGAEEPTASLRHARWMGTMSPAETQGVLHPDWVAGLDPAGLDAPYAGYWNGGDAVTGAMRCDFHLYLQGKVLPKVDRASMAAGLEVRAPFLDVDLVEWLAALPRAWKIRGGRGKYLLRRAFGNSLPAAIVQRRKQGFALPLGAWFHGPLRALVGDLLSPSRIRQSGLWDAKRVGELLEAHWAGRANHGQVLWTLLVFELWREQVLGRASLRERGHARVS